MCAMISAALVCATGCSKKEDPAVEWTTKMLTKQREHPIKDIELKADIGLMLSDDFMLRNLCDRDLTQVQLIFSVKGKSGDSKTLSLNWPQWKRGESKTITIKKGESVSHVSVVELMGFAEQGGMQLSWSFN